MVTTKAVARIYEKLYEVDFDGMRLTVSLGEVFFFLQCTGTLFSGRVLVFLAVIVKKIHRVVYM